MFSQLFLISALFLSGPVWTPQSSGVTSRLRGVSAVNASTAWASGSGSTVLHTIDGGATWKKITVVRDANDLVDFRDIDAIDEKTVYVLSIGNGAMSRIYKTTDAGISWELQFKNEEPKAFYDAMSFWDADHGIVIGDSIDGRFYILVTENGGRSWNRVPSNALPPSLENEGAFAASGTNIAVLGKSHAWIGTGADARARVLRTTDRGRTWKIADTPLAAGESSGIFSIAFRDQRHGVIVGGDYKKETEADRNLAVTIDGGATWTLVTGLTGFRSAVSYVSGLRRPTFVSTGPSGTDYSTDDGLTWLKAEGSGFDTLSIVSGGTVGWGAGIRGSVGKISFEREDRKLRKYFADRYARQAQLLRAQEFSKAMEVDTDDYKLMLINGNSMTRPQLKQRMAAYIASGQLVRQISFDYEVLEVSVRGNEAVVLVEQKDRRIQKRQDGKPHNVEAFVIHRDTWIKTPAGWRRRLTEEVRQTKYTIDGVPSQTR